LFLDDMFLPALESKAEEIGEGFACCDRRHGAA
jgi:hypothetical protein